MEHADPALPGDRRHLENGRKTMMETTRPDNTAPLTVVLLALLVLVDRGADPTIAMGSLVAVVAAVGRLSRG